MHVVVGLQLCMHGLLIDCFSFVLSWRVDCSRCRYSKVFLYIKVVFILMWDLVYRLLLIGWF